MKKIERNKIKNAENMSLDIKSTIIYTECFTCAFHAIMYHGCFVAILDQLRQLPHVRRSGKVENHVLREQGVFVVQCLQRVWLHGAHVKYFVGAIPGSYVYKVSSGWHRGKGKAEPDIPPHGGLANTML